MSFEDKIRQVQGDENSASFRGIPFRVRSDNRTSGRRGTTHQFLFRDNPFREDTGRAAEQFTIEGFIDGNNNRYKGQSLDYIEIRDLLREAIRQDKSPGILILPTYGEFLVSGIRISVATDNRRKGICRLSMTFEESGELSFPTVTENLPATVEIQSTALKTAVTEEAGNETILTSDPDSGVDESEEIVDEFTKSTDQALETGDQNQNSLEEFSRKYELYKANIREKLFVPVQFYEDTQDVYTELRNVWPDENLNDAYDAFRDIFNSAVDDIGKAVDILTPDRVNQEKNSQLLRDGFRNIMLAQMSDITANQSFISNNQVQQRRDELVVLFDQQIDNASNNFDREQRNNLVQLRTDTLATLQAVGGDLPEERTILLPESIPAAELASNLYGDADRAQEIAEANDIMNPIFMPPQVELLVLSA